MNVSPNESFLLDLVIASIIITLSISALIYFTGITRFFERRKALIGQWIGGEKSGFFQVVEVQKVSLLTENVSINKGGKKTTLQFDARRPTYRTKRNTWCYLMDIDKSHVLLNPQDYKQENWMYDEYLTRGGLRHTLAGIAKTPLSGFLIYILLGAMAVLPIGIMIGAFFIHLK
jgi:hypothetical protein